MSTYHVSGSFVPGQVIARWVPDTRPTIPEVESLIDAAWHSAMQRPGVHLFDGPMCRLESWAVQEGSLSLEISHTTYKVFVGTNLSNPELAETYGQSILANALGVSAVLQTSDGFLMLGRRGDRVAYYPRRIHPFAGCMEPHEPLDVFQEVRRELREELRLESGDISRIVCTGLGEDPIIRQPELLFIASTFRTKSEIDAMLDEAEHVGTWSIPAKPDLIRAALDDPEMTPIAKAALEQVVTHANVSHCDRRCESLGHPDATPRH